LGGFVLCRVPLEGRGFVFRERVFGLSDQKLIILEPTFIKKVAALKLSVERITKTPFLDEPSLLKKELTSINRMHLFLASLRLGKPDGVLSF